EMKHQWVEYNQGGTKLKAYLAYDDKVTGRRPAVLMIHAREGMTPNTQSLAEIWAELGYVTFAADIFGYGEGVLPKDVPEMQAQIAIYDKDRAANAKGMFLILHGAEDVGFPLTTVNRLIEELRSAKVPFQLEVYSGTGHGFSTPKNKAEERANAQSIGATARTLKELFGI